MCTDTFLLPTPIHNKAVQSKQMRGKKNEIGKNERNEDVYQQFV